jgi:pilus assembly protein CpaB
MKGLLTTALMIGGALVAGSGAAYFADSYIDRSISQERSQLQSQYEPINVVVAKADLAPGATLSSQTVALRDVPWTFLHSEAIPADGWRDFAGRVLARAVRGGEPVLRSHLAEGLGAGFSAQLPEGMRALTFPVDEEASISGMLSPGDRIDILFTTTAGNETITVPLLFAVPVIATGMRTRANANQLRDNAAASQFRTVTVSVSPTDAAKITLAQDAGKITIALRRPADDVQLRIARVTKSTLLRGDRPVTATSVRGQVQIILGGI